MTPMMPHGSSGRLWSWWVVAFFVLAMGTALWTFSAPSEPESPGVRETPSSTSVEVHPMLEDHPMTPTLAGMTDTLPSYCPFGASATGGGYYLVHVEREDSVRSRHTRLDQAVLSAAEAETENPADSVWISHDFELQIECDPPTAEEVDSISQPVGWVIFTQNDSTGVIEYGVGYDRDGVLMDTVPGAEYPLQYLLWQGDRVIACAGYCDELRRVPRIRVREAARIHEEIRRADR